MKIVAFNGSPRGATGNTHIMVENFLAGAEKAGAETENIILADKKIGHCGGCMACWLKTPGKCVIKDDMEELLEKFSADIIVIATPLYVDNVTGVMKDFLDRTIPRYQPFIERDENGECRHPGRTGHTPGFVVISNCGFTGMEHFQVLKLLFRRVVRNAGTKILAEIYRDGGAILNNPLLLLKPFLMHYNKLLKKAGEELVTDGRISDKTQEKLAKPIVPHEQYLKTANKFFAEELQKLEKNERGTI
ncbi:MAG: flavodoxin family protein [Candidatus Aegiribacteria sp.]|nr:flavodoxin family protein [Candidatus Aegiribacteria sp.]